MEQNRLPLQFSAVRQKGERKPLQCSPTLQSHACVWLCFFCSPHIKNAGSASLRNLICQNLVFQTTRWRSGLVRCWVCLRTLCVHHVLPHTGLLGREQGAGPPRKPAGELSRRRRACAKTAAPPTRSGGSTGFGNGREGAVGERQGRLRPAPNAGHRRHEYLLFSSRCFFGSFRGGAAVAAAKETIIDGDGTGGGHGRIGGSAELRGSGGGRAGL